MMVCVCKAVKVVAMAAVEDCKMAVRAKPNSMVRMLAPKKK